MITEKTQRIMRKYNIATGVKPYSTLRNTFVHPKDKRDTLEKCDVVYRIPCHNCDQVYIGETGRPLKVRMEEHHKEAEAQSVKGRRQ